MLGFPELKIDRYPNYRYSGEYNLSEYITGAHRISKIDSCTHVYTTMIFKSPDHTSEGFLKCLYEYRN